MRKALPLALCGSAALIPAFANAAYALQISDGQYQGVYNGRDLAAAQTRINAIQARDGVAVGSIIAWSKATNPDDSWLECDGRPVDAAKYPDLAAMMTTTPNYANRFLRAGNAANVGQEVDDSIKSHTSHIAPHTHAFEGKLVSNAVSGTANGQSYLRVNGSASGFEWVFNNDSTFYYFYNTTTSNPWIRYNCDYSSGGAILNCYGFSTYSNWLRVPTGVGAAYYWDTTGQSSFAWANVNNGTVNGTNSDAAQTAIYDSTSPNGIDETAPKHVMVRYFIKAR